MADEKVKGDGHTKFILKGGPATGVTVRLYPSDRKKPGILDDLQYAGGMYEHPDRAQQHPKKPFLLFRPN